MARVSRASTASLVAVLLSLALAPATRAGVHFAASGYYVGTQGASLSLVVAAGDFDGDEAIDLAVIGQRMVGTDLTFLFGRGAGDFYDGEIYETDSPPNALAVSDLDADGNADIALATGSPGGISVLYGSGDATFSEDSLAVGEPVNGVAVGNFGGGTDPDIAAVTPTGQAYVLVGAGNRTFATPVASAAGGARLGWVAKGDFNADSLDDLAAITGPGDAVVASLVSNGDGTFQAPRTTALPVFCCASGLAAARLDADARSDIVAGFAFVPNPVVLIAQPDGLLGPAATIAGVAARSTPLPGDHDADGAVDLAMSTSPSGVALLRGNGDGTFAAPLLFDAPATLLTELAVDVNADGYSDLVLGHTSASLIVVAINAPSATPSAGGLAFGPLAGGATSAPQRVTITNDGQPPLSVGAVRLAGAHAADFRLTGEDCTERAIRADGTCTIEVVAAPTAGGTRDAEVVIESNAAEGAQRIALTSSVDAPAPPPPPQPTPQPFAPDRTAPTITIRVERRRLAALARRGLRVRVGCAEPCALDARLMLSRRVARRFGIPRVVARAQARVSGSTRRLTLRPARRTARALRRMSSARLTLVVRARDAAGNRRTAQRSLTLRR